MARASDLVDTQSRDADYSADATTTILRHSAQDDTDIPPAQVLTLSSDAPLPEGTSGAQDQQAVIYSQAVLADLDERRPTLEGVHGDGKVACRCGSQKSSDDEVGHWNKTAFLVTDHG